MENTVSVNVEKRDQEIFDLISEENNRQLHGIELIASENFVSNEVMEKLGIANQ